MHRSFYDRTRRQVRDLSSGPFRILLDIEVRRIQCRQCCAVKRERLSFLADNPFYTQRFAYYVGRRCRSATIKDIAEELRLDWDAVKELDKQYMRAQLKRAGDVNVSAHYVVDRDGTIRALAAQNIQSKPYLPAIHLMSFYRERFGHREGEFPVCEDVAARSLALPFFPEMSEGQVARVAEQLRAVLSD